MPWKRGDHIPFVGTSVADEWKLGLSIWYSTSTRWYGLVALRFLGDGNINLDGFRREVVVPLNEYCIRRFGYNGAVDDRFHHSIMLCMLERESVQAPLSMCSISNGLVSTRDG